MHTLEILRVWFQTTSIKANFALKQVTKNVWFPSECKSNVYTMLYSIKCAIALCLKNNIRTLIKNTLLLKNANHHLSLQWVTTFWLVVGLSLIWWLLTGQGGVCWRLWWLWQFLKVRQWSVPHPLTLSFTNDFSVACNAVWWHCTHRRTSFKIGVKGLPWWRSG